MHPKVILCLDDERIVIDSLQTQLQLNFDNTHVFEFAESAEEAFEIIDEYFENDGLGILVIVSDWLMPGINGDEFLIKVHKKHPRIVKLMLTGQADESAIKKAEKEANLFKCLQKPWDEKELVSSIKEAIEKAEKA